MAHNVRGLIGLAPAAIEERLGRTDACSGGRVILAHDRHKRFDGAFCICARKGANFCKGFSHLALGGWLLKNPESQIVQAGHALPCEQAGINAKIGEVVEP